ncbi:MAG: hypothetical protein D3917_18890 [Candidatus Electrothrix sp. AX5]|nr:hypothetical protein [Candidatus Electrothrix sp. AX5]
MEEGYQKGIILLNKKRPLSQVMKAASSLCCRAVLGSDFAGIKTTQLIMLFVRLAKTGTLCPSAGLQDRSPTTHFSLLFIYILWLFRLHLFSLLGIFISRLLLIFIFIFSAAFIAHCVLLSSYCFLSGKIA